MIKIFLVGIAKVYAQATGGPFGSQGNTSGGLFGANNCTGSSAIRNPLNICSIPELINKILEIIVQIGLPLTAVAIVYVGFLFVTAQGNESKLTEAKKALLWTVIGGAIVLGAFVISTAIQTTIHNL